MEITLKPVVSDTIDSYHYNPEYKDLFVHFKSGGFYVYHECPKALADRLDKRHPWRRIYADVKALPFDKVSKGIKTGPRVRRPAKRNKKKEVA